MVIFLTSVHVIVCVFLILVVLLQTGKGADLAGAFGGSSQTAFGARGASTLLTRLTTASAILFMLTSMILALISTSTTPSVLEGLPAETEAAAPATDADGTGATVPVTGTDTTPAGDAVPDASAEEEGSEGSQ
jgi:preprotein translocase subunit SecG